MHKTSVNQRNPQDAGHYINKHWIDAKRLEENTPFFMSFYVDKPNK